MKITPVILCGGSGTRLWPLSRKSFPKQFVPLIGNKSLIQLTLERVLALTSLNRSGILTEELICVASEDHRFLVTDAIDAAFTSTGAAASHIQKSVLLEPTGRNTAAAMALAALISKQQDNSDQFLLFCPADHHIPDTALFIESVQSGIEAARHGSIVTFGIRPTFPSVAYGYIQEGKARADGSKKVTQFIEKPNFTKAQELLLGGDVLWNAGIFLTSPKTLLHALKRHAPDILNSCESAIALASREIGLTTQSNADKSPSSTFVRPDQEAFKACRSESIDYAVLENFPEVAVVPFNGQWSDVGSWNAVADLIAPDTNGNRVDGSGLAIRSLNTYIYAPHRTVVALGTDNLMIVDTPDALLVVNRTHVEHVKEVVSRLEKDQLSEAVTHRKVARPWGWYDSVDMGSRFQVKRIGVKPGASLSLQKHHHRAEHWIVVAGTAEVTRGSETFLLSENQSTYIPIGEIHRLKNPGKVVLEMIEVQSGGYLGEDDIVRLEDTYGRAPEK